MGTLISLWSEAVGDMRACLSQLCLHFGALMASSTQENPHNSHPPAPAPGTWRHAGRPCPVPWPGSPCGARSAGRAWPRSETQARQGRPCGIPSSTPSSKLSSPSPSAVAQPETCAPPQAHDIAGFAPSVSTLQRTAQSCMAETHALMRAPFSRALCTSPPLRPSCLPRLWRTCVRSYTAVGEPSSNMPYERMRPRLLWRMELWPPY
mmetsp:Transcript_31761/g.91280  ORF Transcript_31761/g.91280 Transcript_31761/m.91280 type:complete len:207 (-) Transcript_31761:853-1473(-)